MLKVWAKGTNVVEANTVPIMVSVTFPMARASYFVLKELLHHNVMDILEKEENVPFVMRTGDRNERASKRTRGPCSNLQDMGTKHLKTKAKREQGGRKEGRNKM